MILTILVPLVPLRHPPWSFSRDGYQRHGTRRDKRVAGRGVPDQDDTHRGEVTAGIN
jgi:hypothetical protein